MQLNTKKFIFSTLLWFYEQLYIWFSFLSLIDRNLIGLLSNCNFFIFINFVFCACPKLQLVQRLFVP